MTRLKQTLAIVLAFCMVCTLACVLPMNVSAGGNYVIKLSEQYNGDYDWSHGMDSCVFQNDTSEDCTVILKTADGVTLASATVMADSSLTMEEIATSAGVSISGMAGWYVSDVDKNAKTCTLTEQTPVNINICHAGLEMGGGYGIIHVPVGTTPATVINQISIDCSEVPSGDRAACETAIKNDANFFRFLDDENPDTVSLSVPLTDDANEDCVIYIDGADWYNKLLDNYPQLRKYRFYVKPIVGSSEGWFSERIKLQVYNDTISFFEEILRRTWRHPEQNETKLIMPDFSDFPCGDYKLTIEDSDNENVIKKDGTIIPPEEETDVRLKVKMTRGDDEEVFWWIRIVPARSADFPVPSASATQPDKPIGESIGDNLSSNFKPEDPITSSSGSTSSNKSNKSERRRSVESSGGGSGGHVAYSAPTTTATAPATTATTATTQTLDPDTAESAASKAIQSAAPDAQVVRVNFRNVTTLTPEALQAVADVAAQADVDAIVTVDTMLDENRVFARIYVDAEEGAKLSQDINVAVKPASENLQAQFEKYFSNANMAVLDFGQKGEFGMEVQVAAKIDVEGWDTATLYFYIYDMETNSYRRIANPDYWIDSNGYLHFTTDEGNYIIITDEPLHLK